MHRQQRLRALHAGAVDLCRRYDILEEYVDDAELAILLRRLAEDKWSMVVALRSMVGSENVGGGFQRSVRRTMLVLTAMMGGVTDEMIHQLIADEHRYREELRVARFAFAPNPRVRDTLSWVLASQSALIDDLEASIAQLETL